jgi:hypothetical protein
VLPDFTVDGVLPPGDYPLTLPELRSSLLVVGPLALVAAGAWDAAWRATLVDNLALIVGHLWQVGIERIFIDGSFVEDKAHPNDIDGYFECQYQTIASGALEAALNALDPHRTWTWDAVRRRFDPDSGKRQLPMWHVYRVELYPHFPGLLSGISDQFGNELQFPSAFRQQRSTFAQKGIVQVVKEHARHPGGSR